VGTTGLIYAAIVIAWAAYLVPLALRRSRLESRDHSIERFSSAMRVLSRKGPREGDRVRPPATAPAEPSWPADIAAVAPATDLSPLRRRQTAARRAAARRRRVLVVLLTVAAVVGAAAALGYYLPSWAAAVPLSLVLGFLVVARSQVRKSRRAYRRAVAGSQRAALVRPRAARADESDGPVAVPPSDAMPADLTEDPDADEFDLTELEPDDQATRRMPLDLRGPEVQEAVPIESDDVAGLWDPVPVTLPTYVTKPAAHRQVRTVDLAAPGARSSARGGDGPAAHRTEQDQKDETARAVGE
jgi:general stress protein CsbA